MKLKQLESLLQDVEPFREPDQMLEQYPTGAHLASRVVAEAHAHGCLLYTSPSPRDRTRYRMPSSA